MWVLELVKRLTSPAPTSYKIMSLKQNDEFEEAKKEAEDEAKKEDSQGNLQSRALNKLFNQVKKYGK